MATNITIYNGSPIFTSGSSTPFGLYDNDTNFCSESISTVDWCAKRLGYPIVDIELQDPSFFACFEEAVTEYSSQVNYYNIKENLLSLKGTPTGSDLTHKEITPNHGRLITLAQNYGSEAGVGGSVSHYSASLKISSSKQSYDLTSATTWNDAGSTGLFGESETVTADLPDWEIKRVFYEGTPAMTRYFDPYIGTGQGSDHLLDGFGMGNYSPAINFLIRSIQADRKGNTVLELEAA